MGKILISRDDGTKASQVKGAVWEKHSIWDIQGVGKASSLTWLCPTLWNGIIRVISAFLLCHLLFQTLYLCL